MLSCVSSLLYIINSQNYHIITSLLKKLFDRALPQVHSKNHSGSSVYLIKKEAHVSSKLPNVLLSVPILCRVEHIYMLSQFLLLHHPWDTLFHCRNSQHLAGKKMGLLFSRQLKNHPNTIYILNTTISLFEKNLNSSL